MKNFKGVYLAAYRAQHEKYNIDYQDINGKRDIDGDMLNVDLSRYDFVIATPPCNYWSRANYRRETSEYAQQTKHLLPEILNKLIFSEKPYIVENVRNYERFKKANLINLPCYIYFIGRHTYWTNIWFSDEDIFELTLKQSFDFKTMPTGTARLKKNSQGGDNVHLVIEKFLEKVHNGEQTHFNWKVGKITND